MSIEQTITMRAKELSRYETITRLIQKQINGTEAAKLLNLTVRQIKNLKRRVVREGAQGLIHKNRGRPSNRRIIDETIEDIRKIVQEKYHDFGPTFAAEKLQENHGITISREKLRGAMTDWGLWTPQSRKQNKEYRSWRERKEYYGEMEQFDGSYHRWFEDRAPVSCLLASIDDASGKITGARFVGHEGVMPAFSFWKRYLEAHGKPCAIYLDRHSAYKVNAKSLFDDPKALSQFERAMDELQIKVIHALSPQAKGRAERLFGTLQDRLVKELRLARISTIDEANRFLEEVFIPKFNGKFSVRPAKRKDLHRALTKKEVGEIGRIFSVRNIRRVNNDFTLRFKGQWFQLAQTQPALVLRKDRVLIEERMDGSVHLSLRGKYLNFSLLPARPERVRMKVTALTTTKPQWKPPANHPWRRFVFSPMPPERYQTSAQVPNSS